MAPLTMTPIEAACRACCVAEGVDPDLPCPVEVEHTPGGTLFRPAWIVREARVRAIILAFLEHATADPSPSARRPGEAVVHVDP